MINKKLKPDTLLFEKLSMSEYLVKNLNTSLSQILFRVRSGTLDIKSWCEWNYSDKHCVMCSNSEENIEHLISCQEYGNSLKTNWKLMFENDSQ